MKLVISLAAATAALALGVGPAAAGQPTFGCITTGGNASGGSLVFTFAASPGDEGWADELRDCRDVKSSGNGAGGHPQALR